MNVIVPLSIVTTSAWLGEKKSRDSYRRFSTDKQGKVTYFSPNISQWRWAFKSAMESLALPDDVDMDFIRFPNRINMPTVRLYERVWCPKDPAKRETFECFPKGTIISFQIFLLRERENSWENKIQLPGRAPTKEELVKCFETIGAHIGLSPWGSDKGYGRFEMVDKS